MHDRVRTIRSPLRLERNPSLADDDLERILLLRGAFVAATGQIETIITEFAIRASKHPSYASVSEEFPTHRGDRFDYVRRLCDHPGPLEAYKGLMLKIVDLFDAATPLRDTFAHARMRAFSGSTDGVTMRFTDWDIKKQKKKPAIIKRREEPMKLSELERYAKRMARLSRAVESLYYRLNAIFPTL